jgi:hypothetical protein
MSEKLVSFMLDEGVLRTLKDYCFKKQLKIKHVIREAIIIELNIKGRYEKFVKR